MSSPLVTPNLLAQMKQAQGLQALAAPVAPPLSMPAPALSLSAPSLPSVVNQPSPADMLHRQLSADQAERDRRVNSGSGVDQIQNPLLRGIARAGDIAASIFAPGIARSIPGTTLHHQVLVNQAERNLASDQAAQKAADASVDTQSQTHERESLANKADALAAADTPVPITPELAEAAGVPQLAGTSLPMRDYQRILANHQTVQGRITTNQTTNDTRQSISDDKLAAQKDVAAQKPMQRDDHYIQVMEKSAAQRTPEDVAFKQAYESLINTKTTQPGIARAVAFGQNRPVQVIDPTSNNVVYQTAGNAMRSGAATPTSADYTADKALQKDFTSGKAAQNLTAFNTATAHLQQLGVAAEALQNGNVQLLNKAAQGFAQQTGGTAPTNFEAVKGAVAGEIGKVFKGGNATDQEIKEMNAAINKAQSPAQLKGVIQTYSTLMQSKRDALQQQYEAGKAGKPNFAGESSTHDPLGIR